MTGGQIDQLARQPVHPRVARRVDRLVDVEHDREHVGRRVGQHGVLRVDDPHAGVQQRGLVDADHVSKAVDERDEAIARHEVLVQNVGLAGQAVLEVAHGVVHGLVAGDQARLALGLGLRAAHRTGLQARLQVFLGPPLRFHRQRAELGQVEDEAPEIDPAQLGQRRDRGARGVGPPVAVEQHLAQERAARRGQVPVHQADGGVGLELTREDAGELAIVEQPALRAIDDVVGDLQLGVEDHAEQAVAAEHQPEQLGVLGAGGPHHRAVGQHHAHRPQRAADRAGRVVHAVGVDGDRAAHGEDVGGLHRLHREAGVQELLDVVPGGAALRRQRARLGVEPQAVEARHVEHDGARREGLSSHAVADAGDRHPQAVLAGEAQGRPDVVLLTHADDAVHRSAVQAAGVVDRPASLRPRQRVRRHGRRTRRHGVGATRRQGQTVLVTHGIGRVLHGPADNGAHGQRQHEQDDGERAGEPAPQSPGRRFSSRRCAPAGRRCARARAAPCAARPPACAGSAARPRDR
jgi:hypothetical protein